MISMISYPPLLILLGAIPLGWLSPLPAAETLYNGIELTSPWPPRGSELTRRPLATPPYLQSPPAIIPIDTGRQLLIDDFLIEQTDLQRTYHRPDYHPASPVIAPDRPWEDSRSAVFSDGVWFDPADRLFKAWYWCKAGTCYATSTDGIRWQKPNLDVVPGTNVVVPFRADFPRNSSTVWLDLFEKDPARRFKMFTVVTNRAPGEGGETGNRKFMEFRTSSDGIHWQEAGRSSNCGDRSTVFFNPFRQRWVFSLREFGEQVGRARGYHESPDVLSGLSFGSRPGDKVWENALASGAHDVRFWVGADELDPAREDLRLRRLPERPWDLVPSQLYNLDGVAYESVILGLFSIWRGHPQDTVRRPKINEVTVGFSRDGFHWTRPDRRAFLPVSEDPKAWNHGNVQSAGGCVLVVGDKLHFYMGGATFSRGSRFPDPSSTGLAILRRDGFASFDADAQGGTLTTRSLRFSGRHLWVNADCSRGELRVDVLDPAGNVLLPFSRGHCTPLKADQTAMKVNWTEAPDLRALAGKPVKFRFHLSQGSLYSFWVSPDARGASGGYVGAGGPGFSGPTDTVGPAGNRP